jgi:hypothetical protein
MADTDETARTSTDRARRVLRAQLAALTDRIHTESDVLNVRVAARDSSTPRRAWSSRSWRA